MGINNSQYYYTYHPSVLKVDIGKIDNVILKRIQYSLENKLINNPMVYSMPLHGPLMGYWKLRVGDYRVVYSIIKHEIRILGICHRKNVYNLILKRI